MEANVAGRADVEPVHEFVDAGDIGPQAGFVASMVGYEMRGLSPTTPPPRRS